MKLQTPFYGKHLEYGCKWLEIPGLLLQVPEVFTSVEEEVRMVRQRAGFIDYSCLQGKITVAGKEAFGFLQKVLVNDIRKIAPGKAIYTTMLDEKGKIIDDLILNWDEENLFTLDTGATEAAYEWLRSKATGLDVYVIKVHEAMLALQGPKSREVLQKVMSVDDLSYFSFKYDILDDIPVRIARLGFTGEPGFELYVEPKYAHSLWDTLMELGKEHEVRPYGLMAGRVLATEKGYVWAPDFYEGATPLEIGLEWTVAFDKDDFFGKDALLKRKNEGLKTKLMGFEVSDSNVVASKGDNLLKEDKVVGEVTKAFYGYTVEKSIGAGWVEIEHANEGEELEVEHENKRTTLKLVRNKWYDPGNEKVRG